MRKNLEILTRAGQDGLDDGADRKRVFAMAGRHPLRRHPRSYRDDDASLWAAVNARKLSTNSGRRATPRAPLCVAPSMTTTLSVGRTDVSCCIAARLASALPMRPR